MTAWEFGRLTTYSSYNHHLTQAYWRVMGTGVDIRVGPEIPDHGQGLKKGEQDEYAARINASVQDHLAALGRDGWELVTALPAVYWLKRPISG